MKTTGQIRAATTYPQKRKIRSDPLRLFPLDEDWLFGHGNRLARSWGCAAAIEVAYHCRASTGGRGCKPLMGPSNRGIEGPATLSADETAFPGIVGQTDGLTVAARSDAGMDQPILELLYGTRGRGWRTILYLEDDGNFCSAPIVEVHAGRRA